MSDHRYTRLLTIAGSDSGGGAGIQADLKTFSALGGYGMSVITALTAQNTIGVMGVHAAPPQFIAQQLDAVLSDIGVDAVKIGMLASPDIIETIAERLRFYNAPSVVLDPVMVAKSGDKLLQDNAIEALRKTLLPLATVLTPNLPEASVLLSRYINTRHDMEKAARDLQALGAKHVLVKGGHLTEQGSADCLATADGAVYWFEEERIETRNTHGTGCTLSSAIAAFLARGESIENAVRKSKHYLTGAIRAGAAYRLGNGHGPVHHFYALWKF